MINVALYEKAFVDSQSKIDRIVSKAGVMLLGQLWARIIYKMLVQRLCPVVNRVELGLVSGASRLSSAKLAT